MSANRVTLSDIAKELGVSVNTVSHALNDKSDISEAVKVKIKLKADEMGYIHNSIAGSMRSGKSMCIAVIVGDISNPHFSIMIKEIETVAFDKGYTVLVLNTFENEEIERQAIKASLSRGVDGIIICPVQKTNNNINYLIKSQIPFTLIGRYFKNIDTNYVVCDDINGGYLAASYLINKGHKKIAVFMAPEYISSSEERKKGIENAFAENNVTASDINTYIVSPSLSEKDRVAFAKTKNCTAAICFSDLIALALLSEREGSDIEIVSFDHIRSKFYMPLSFKSITSSKTKMSHHAFKILINNIEDPYSEKQHIVLPTEIVIN